MVFSPGSNLLVMPLAQGAVQFVDLATKKPEQSALLQVNGYALALSRDGNLLAVGAGAGSILLIDTKTRAVKLRLEDHKQTIFALAFAFSPDGKLLASGETGRLGSDVPIRLWDVSSGKLLGRLDGHQSAVHALAFLQDGKVLVSAGRDNTVRFWDVTKRRQVASIDVPLTAMAASPDGKTLATCAETAEVRLWDAASRKQTGKLTARCGVCGLAFSPDGKRLATGGHSRTLQLWDVASGREALPLPGHREAVVSLAFSPDGKELASRGNGRTVRLWDLASRKERLRLQVDPWPPVGMPQAAGSLAFSPDGTRLVSRSGGSTSSRKLQNTTFPVWDIKSGKELQTFADPPTYPPQISFAFSPGGEVLASACDGVRLRSLATGGLLRHLGAAPRSIVSVAFSPDGRTFAAGGMARRGSDTLLLWDWQTGALLHTLPGNRFQVGGLAFSPGGHYLASCGGKPCTNDGDPGAHLWETASGSLIRTFKGHGSAVTCVALSPDGKLLASACYGERGVRLWDVFGGKELTQFDEHLGRVPTVSSELAKFEGHLGPVLTVAFSPDGTLLATGSEDTTILLWDISHIRGTPPPPAGGPAALARLWDELQKGEAGPAFQAVWALAGTGDQAADFLAKHLKPVPAADGARLRKLLADLDNTDFRAREAAEKGLAELAPVFEPELRQALKGGLSAEARRRLSRLLERPRRSLEALRQGRALLALELAGTPKARELLRRLAGGAPGASLTRAAQAASQRLDRRAEKR
jgi:WD40 repeat protein